MSPKQKESWSLEPHICRACGGRILRALHSVVTGGGNPLFRCADCGKAGAAMDTSHLCWCGFAFKGSYELKGTYRCVPFAILKEKPELRYAFAACGSNPDGGQEIGVMTEDAWVRFSAE